LKIDFEIELLLCTFAFNNY